MQSLRELYKIGRGPSSSHTMGPERAIKTIKDRYSSADFFKIELFGSLALTGEGHGTDRIIRETLSPIKCEITLDKKSPCDFHPNTMDIYAYQADKLLSKERVYSVGGGTVVFDGEIKEEIKEVYPHNSFTEIADYCAKKNIRIWQYVEEFEGKEIFSYLANVWECMKNSIREGLTTTGTLPGGLKTQRKAQFLYNQRHIDESAQTRENRLVCSYAFAVSEQNASGGTIVTAPTCGSCGVLPSVLMYSSAAWI